MQLTITFAGLILFVPEVDGSVLHAIMPNTRSHHGGGDPHETRLIPDAGTHAREASLDDFLLDLRNVASDAASGAPSLPEGLMELQGAPHYETLRMPQSYLMRMPRPQEVAAHIMLQGGKLIGDARRCFAPPHGTGIPDTPTVITWTAEVDGDVVPEISLLHLRRQGADGSLPSIPQNQDGKAWLCIANTTAADRPPSPGHVHRPTAPFDPSHFHHYHQFWSPQPHNSPTPCPNTASFVTYPRICPVVFVPAE